MKFKKGNKIRYSQDHADRVGIPSGVDFAVEYCGAGYYKLTAPGYGETENSGSGPLFVWGLTSSQTRQFVRTARKKKNV